MSHDQATATRTQPPLHLDYSLVGEDAARAVERGLAEADWYQTPVPRAELRKLLERRDGPALRDTLLWFAILGTTGTATGWLWPSAWAALPYLIYCVYYATASDSRWHEAGHGTAFKTDWMNNIVYEVASFMVLRNATLWRWSHSGMCPAPVKIGLGSRPAVRFRRSELLEWIDGGCQPVRGCENTRDA